ncbi:MAG TPA: hypothetical protein VMN36_09750 [Verrucomicrobiales bacterium]|nr:hypothetical protein [Verrucomicrobiales bacterium]
MADPLNPGDPGDRNVALTAYALGELEGEAMAEVAQWLTSDASARREVAQIQALADTLAAEFSAAESPGLTEQQRTALLAGLKPEEEKIVRPLRWIRSLCTLGVAAGLVAFAGVALWQQFGNPAGKSVAFQGLSQEEAPAGEELVESQGAEPALAPRMSAADPPPGASFQADGPRPARSIASADAAPEQGGIESRGSESPELAVADAAEPSVSNLRGRGDPGVADPGLALGAAEAEADRAVPGPPSATGRRPNLRVRPAGVESASELRLETVFALGEERRAEFRPVPREPFSVPLSTSTGSFEALREALRESIREGGPLPGVDWRASDFVSGAAQAAGPLSGDAAEVRLRSAQSPGPAATWLVSVAAGFAAEADTVLELSLAELRFQIDPERIQGFRVLGYDWIAGEAGAGAGAAAEGGGSLEPGKWAGLLCELVPRPDPATFARGAGEAAGRPWLSVRLVQSGDAESNLVEAVQADGLLTEQPGPWVEADMVLRAQAAAAALGAALERGEEASADQVQQWEAWVPGSGGGSVLGDLREMLRSYPGLSSGRE